MFLCFFLFKCLSYLPSFLIFMSKIYIRASRRETKPMNVKNKSVRRLMNRERKKSGNRRVFEFLRQKNRKKTRKEKLVKRKKKKRERAKMNWILGQIFLKREGILRTSYRISNMRCYFVGAINLYSHPHSS